MNLTLANPTQHELLYDVRAFYILLKLEKRFLKRRLISVTEKLEELEQKYRIKQEV